jgi:tetratricopeptide (TPR) repeat protein
VTGIINALTRTNCNKTISARNYTDLGIALAAGRFADAESAYGSAIQADSDFYEAHLAVGQMLAGRGDFTEARAHLEKAAESPDPAARKILQ